MDLAMQMMIIIFYICQTKDKCALSNDNWLLDVAKNMVFCAGPQKLLKPIKNVRIKPPLDLKHLVCHKSTDKLIRY